MVSLTALVLPILVSAVLVFLASMILHAALPFWHRRDYRSVPDDRAFVEGARPLDPGFYAFPSAKWNEMNDEQKAEWRKGPVGFMWVRRAASISMAETFVQHFLYCFLGSFLAAYVASITVGPGSEYMLVHRVTGATGMIFWAFGTNVSDASWYGKPWSAVVKYLVDAVIYGFLIGGTFGWLWPS